MLPFYVLTQFITHLITGEDMLLVVLYNHQISQLKVEQLKKVNFSDAMMYMDNTNDIFLYRKPAGEYG